MQGSVVLGCGEAEAVFDEVFLACLVAAVHSTDLWYGDVALVDDEQVVVGEEIEQAVGALAGLAAVEIARVVLDAGAMAQLAYHLDVIVYALVDALCLEGFAYAGEILDLLFQVLLYLAYCLLLGVLACHEEVGGVYAVIHEGALALHAFGVEFLQGFDLVVPEGDAQDGVCVCEPDVQGVAYDAYLAT